MPIIHSNHRQLCCCFLLLANVGMHVTHRHKPYSHIIAIKVFTKLEYDLLFMREFLFRYGGIEMKAKPFYHLAVKML